MPPGKAHIKMLPESKIDTEMLLRVNLGTGMLLEGKL